VNGSLAGALAVSFGLVGIDLAHAFEQFFGIGFINFGSAGPLAAATAARCRWAIFLSLVRHNLLLLKCPSTPENKVAEFHKSSSTHYQIHIYGSVDSKGIGARPIKPIEERAKSVDTFRRNSYLLPVNTGSIARIYVRAFLFLNSEDYFGAQFFKYIWPIQF
jgi:hypothetical protein